ncbi:MAG: helix-turn-helix domain-containing protein [Galbitalea sp.]
MTFHNGGDGPLEPVLTISQVAEHLGVPVQTIYDLRLSDRGLHGFRVGKELRFRVSEIRDWLARLEADDIARHAEGQSDAGR